MKRFIEQTQLIEMWKLVCLEKRIIMMSLQVHPLSGCTNCPSKYSARAHLSDPIAFSLCKKLWFLDTSSEMDDDSIACEESGNEKIFPFR